MGAISGWFDDNLVNIVNGLAFGILLYVLAVGLTVIFGMLSVLNLAHGTLFLLGAYLAVRLVDGSGSLGSVLLALGVAIVVGLAAGGTLAVATRPLMDRGHMDQALLTLGISLAGASLMSSAFGADPKSVPIPRDLDHSLSLAGHPYPIYRLIVIGVGLLIALVIELVLERTSLGATVRAIVADREMVRALGIDDRRIVFGVFAVGAALALVGGVLGGPILGASPGLDSQVLLITLVVVVIGGLGSARGALIGAVVIGLVQNLGVALIPQYAPFLIFGAMAVVLLVRPSGLLGRFQEAA